MMTGNSNPPGRQRGVVFYLFVLLALVTLASLGIVAGKQLLGHQALQDQHAMQLHRARDLVLAHLSQPELFIGGSRLGQFSALPDLPTSSGAAIEATEPNYDGQGETTGCAYRSWSTGQVLRQPSVTGAAARCFGRLPWQSLGFSADGHDAADLAGQVPWLIVSPNLVTGSICLPNLTPAMLGQAFTGYQCPSHQPYPWLRVVDARGNLLSDRVAFAVLMPGAPHAGQVRSATAPVSAYLDQVTIAPGCQAPCQPGTYNNAGYNHADGTPWTLISASGRGPLVNSNTTYNAPVRFNDHVAWVTIDELMRFLQDRARQQVALALEAFRTARGHYPYAAPTGAIPAACASGTRLGHPPSSDGSCGAGGSLALPATLTNAGWQRYFIYAVSARCVASNPACIAPGLTVGSSNNANALLFSPGQPLVNPPYASARGAPQQPLTGSNTWSGNPADWLDRAENAGGTTDRFELPDKTASNENDALLQLF